MKIADMVITQAWFSGRRSIENRPGFDWRGLGEWIWFVTRTFMGRRFYYYYYYGMYSDKQRDNTQWINNVFPPGEHFFM